MFLSLMINKPKTGQSTSHIQEEGDAGRQKLGGNMNVRYLFPPSPEGSRLEKSFKSEDGSCRFEGLKGEGIPRRPF